MKKNTPFLKTKARGPLLHIYRRIQERNEVYKDYGLVKYILHCDTTKKIESNITTE